jgi:DNA-binding PadR family transcriptional regulator
MRWREIDRLGGKLLSDGVLGCAKAPIQNSLDNITRIPIYRNPSMGRKPTRFAPLSAASLHILLALAGDELHGYGIMLEAARQSDGKYKLGPGTLYDNLKKLLAAGIVEESRRQPAGEDPRRRYYRITGLGRRVLAEEISRLEAVLREAKAVLQGTRTNIA